MDPSLRSIKTNNWSASPQWVLHLSPRYSQVTLVRGYRFWQLSIDSNMDVHKDATICLEYPASNPGHYKIDDSQSKRVYYCSHII